MASRCFFKAFLLLTPVHPPDVGFVTVYRRVRSAGSRTVDAVCKRDPHGCRQNVRQALVDALWHPPHHSSPDALRSVRGA